jgi:type IV pilus assembly protein PilB
MVQQLGQILARDKHIDAAILAEAVVEARREGIYIGEYLIAHRGLSEEVVFRALAEQCGMVFLSEIEPLINHELVRDLPADLFKEGRCFPLASDDAALKIVVKNPHDLDVLLALSALTGQNIVCNLSTPAEMERVRLKLFSADSSFKQSAGQINRALEKQAQSEDVALTIEEMKKRTESEPVVKMARLIFGEAIRLNASDIHIEPGDRDAVVRFRIDGMLRKHTDLTLDMYVPLTSRVKILADLDIAEKRIPQDGRIRHLEGGKTYDFRVSTLPTHYGEKTVIRVLKHDDKLADLGNLGIPAGELIVLRELIEKPQGMVFVTGPTGSGKSSTLFASLNKIKHKAINITTIENPIEYKVPGVSQVQINEKAGITFASTLRSILRQDPDVILVGEIRDRETAEIAMQASQTGHLVFSTLHTNDAISAITRLRDLGIPGFLIGSSLLGILAQRLVRVLCPLCKQQSAPSPEVRKRWEMLLGDTPIPESHQAIGCKECSGIGYKGRTGIFELVTVTDSLRELISQEVPETKLRRKLRQEGMQSLIMNGMEKIQNGITTPEELLRVVLVEDAVELRNRESDA